MHRSQGLYMNFQTSKFMTLSYTLMQIKSYSFNSPFRNLSNIKIEFDLILSQLMTSTSNLSPALETSSRLFL